MATSAAASGLSGACGGVAMREYVGYLAGWFGLGGFAAARRLKRAGLRTALLNDA
jgi:hypothetical protein